METASTTAADTNTEPGPTSLPTRTELDLSHLLNDELASDIPFLDTRNWPRDITSFQDFDPLQDRDAFQDFDPLQDHDAFQDFDPLQDWHDLQDPEFYVDTEEILKNSENLHIPCDNTTHIAREHLGQASDSYARRVDGAMAASSLANASLSQSVY
ncbi:hypothetical protein NUU61_001402 [Penicillium alfredii]|uniref:Uncharacterized protein n=1 Tax=Penicillium alfredii TaxID=1506179 RepID=A0A9W9G5P1_9EURO|nr:uncharacterized protein NUU61_001402 [Penicillium alfredii]KAJ5111772.1 hypothetical protein NUU61_001402 [Penicillium alfredii]